jgi:hypothetical protein
MTFAELAKRREAMAHLSRHELLLLYAVAAGISFNVAQRTVLAEAVLIDLVIFVQARPELYRTRRHR